MDGDIVSAEPVCLSDDSRFKDVITAVACFLYPELRRTRLIIRKGVVKICYGLDYYCAQFYDKSVEGGGPLTEVFFTVFDGRVFPSHPEDGYEILAIYAGRGSLGPGDLRSITEQDLALMPRKDLAIPVLTGTRVAGVLAVLEDEESVWIQVLSERYFGERNGVRIVHSWDFSTVEELCKFWSFSGS